MQKAVFLDKDGTLIKDVPYNVDITKVEMSFYAFEALKLFQLHGYKLIIVSNQSGIALSIFDIAAFKKLQQYIVDIFLDNQIVLDGFYYCPHDINGSLQEYSVACDCRKPLPGMLLQAAKDMDIDLSNSWMIGDILNDVEAGARAGCKTILINNGNETEWMNGTYRTPSFLVKDLKEAAQIITGTY